MPNFCGVYFKRNQCYHHLICRIATILVLLKQFTVVLRPGAKPDGRPAHRHHDV
jgi:hypothetical protein